MNKLKRNIMVFDKLGKITIHFYENNNMPALLIEDDYGNLMDNLTTNHMQHIEDSVSVRSDEGKKKDLLIEAGWITDDLVKSYQSGFINIDYYKLTDQAILAIKAREDELAYEKECAENE